MNVFSFFFFLGFWGCGPKVLNFPGPTKYIGKRSRSYVKQFEQDIRGEKTEQAKSKSQNESSSSSNIGKKIAQQAGRSVGKTTLTYKSKRYRYDCSGFVEAAYAAGGVPLAGASKTLFETAKKKRLLHNRKRPQPGDIAFFDNTFDRNKNGRRDDKITHVAIVEKVDGDGLITLVHLGSRGIHRTLQTARA